MRSFASQIYSLPIGRVNLELIAVDLLKLAMLVKLGHTGGDKEIRTLDLLLARQALSQLSYTPMII